MTDDDDLMWIDHKDHVTPDDIRRVYQEAIDAGEDPEEARAVLDAAIRESGGIEQMAALWSHQNQLRKGLAAFRAQIERPSRMRRHL